MNEYKIPPFKNFDYPISEETSAIYFLIDAFAHLLDNKNRDKIPKVLKFSQNYYLLCKLCVQSLSVDRRAVKTFRSIKQTKKSKH